MALFMGGELEQADVGDVLEIPLEGWERNLRKRRKRREEGIQEGGSDGETQMEKGTEGTETDVSGWAWVVPGRGDVSRSTTVGGSFGEADVGMEHLGK